MCVCMYVCVCVRICVCVYYLVDVCHLLAEVERASLLVLDTLQLQEAGVVVCVGEASVWEEIQWKKGVKFSRLLTHRYIRIATAMGFLFELTSCNP
jgi:hypothetical protein